MDFQAGAIFAIDKPYGMTSFKALAHIRYLLTHTIGRRVKIGHAGTLDPLATGVLVLCTGKCTKQIEQLQTHTKEYVATLQFGATTPSYDMEHAVNAEYPTDSVNRESLLQAFTAFVGDIEQVPPSYSACKVDGERAYSLKRAGEAVALKPKKIHIDRIDLLDFDPKQMKATIKVVCGKGTYIRALARDIGRALNSGAYLTSLRRTKAGDIAVEDCIDFNNFQAWLDNQNIEKRQEI